MKPWKAVARSHACTHRPRSISTSQTVLKASADDTRNTSIKLRDREEERDFFLNVLGASTTKRDANSYLKNFKVEETKLTAPKQFEHTPNTHVALVKIRALQTLDDATLVGVCRTLSQMSRLGMQPIVVVDCEIIDFDKHLSSSETRKLVIEQSDRLCELFEDRTPSNACRVDYALAVMPRFHESMESAAAHNDVQVQWNLIRSPLRRGMIPIIPALGATLEDQRVVNVDADDAMVALVKAFTDVSQSAKEPFSTTVTSAAPHYTMDRIIVLDPLGGIPSLARPDKAHIFINLEQEYDEIKQELRNPNLQAEHELQEAGSTVARRERHVRNVELLQNTLSLLPSTSSALVTSPIQAAILNGSSKPPTPAQIGVRTRRPRNPLIFNLLTDKPLMSSSLPIGRMTTTSTGGDLRVLNPCPATFVKRGMPVTMIPDPRVLAWKPPVRSNSPLTLQDPRINQKRLWELIEDSFGRPLDKAHYINRIQDRLAGIIVAGDYEGGAILTWELPTGVADDGSDEVRRRMVPYLDKFAVLKRSQGAGGVADVVFSAMVRTCFPNGVCWRSRKNNPVNKWYFERSTGSYKIPNTQWTMFWTEPGLEQDQQRFLDYVAVCRDVKPSWADNKPAD